VAGEKLQLRCPVLGDTYPPPTPRRVTHCTFKKKRE